MKIYFLFLVSFSFLWEAFAVGVNWWTWEESEASGTLVTWLLSLFSADFLLKIIIAIFLIVFTIILSKVIKEKLFGVLERSNIGDESGKEEVIGVISRTVNIIVLITGFSLTLWVLGLDLGIFMWGIWFGIGFTLKTFLTNFISGIIVVSQGSYYIGDFIEVGAKKGNITKINALFTEVRELDGVVFNIPNIRFFEEDVRNYHTNDKRRVDVDLVVDYDTDILTAKKVLQKVVSNFPQVMPAPEPDILIESFADKGINLCLRCWIHSKEDFVHMKSNITETVNMAFKQTGINMPYPQLVVNQK